MTDHPAHLIPFDQLLSQLREAVARKEVSERVGPGSLRLFSYTKQTTAEKNWTPITMMARGLVLDVDAREIVATPFPKFFNWLERPGDTVPDEPFEVTEKLDGSLIILFWWKDKWYAVTRGSFESSQAKWAQAWIDERDLSPLQRGVTYLCEAIYPENQIVVSYTRSGLEFLAAYDETGRELRRDQLEFTAQRLGWNVARSRGFRSISDLLAHTKTLGRNEEGFVLRFKSGLRLKFKGEEYLRMHRLASRCTPLGVWAMIEAKDDLDVVRAGLPEEFWDDYDRICYLLNKNIYDHWLRVEEINRHWKNLSDKEVAERLDQVDADVRPFVFARRKKGSILSDPKTRATLFRNLRPTGNVLEGYVPTGAVGKLEAAL